MKVGVPAIKTKSGKIIKAPSKKWSHNDIIEDSGTNGTRGFVLSDGTFVGRERAAKVANAAGQTKNKRKLHSEDLRKKK